MTSPPISNMCKNCGKVYLFMGFPLSYTCKICGKKNKVHYIRIPFIKDIIFNT